MRDTVVDFSAAELQPEQLESMLRTDGLDLAVILGRHLWDGLVHVRRNAAHALRLAGERELGADQVRLLAVATKDVDAVVRAHCLLAMSRLTISVEEALPVVLRGLADAAAPVRAAAADALDALAKRHGSALIPHLVRALFDQESEIRFAASELLAASDESAGPLVDALVVPEPAIRDAIVRILRRIGEPATLALIRALHDPLLRNVAVRLLAQRQMMSAQSRAHLEQLAGGAADPDVQQAAADVLERLGVGDFARMAREAGEVPVIPVDGWTERALAPAELDAAAATAEVSTPTFASAFRDGRAVARQNAAAVVGRRVRGGGAEAGALAFRLSALVRDPVVDVRLAAVEALADAASDASIAPLLAATADLAPEVAAAARAALERIGARAAGWILDELRPGHPQAARAAALAALRGYGAEGVPALVTALEEHISPVARQAAAEVLAELGDAGRGAVPTLIKALRDPSDEVRGAAARALGAIDASDPAILAALTEATKESTGAVRAATTRATARLLRDPETPPPPPSPLDGDLTPEQATELAKSKTLDFASVVRRDLWNGRAATRRNAALVLRQLTDGAVPTDLARLIAVATRDLDAGVRRESLLALGYLDAPLDHALPALLRGLSDPVEMVRAAARDGLDELARRARTLLIPHLVRALLDAQPEVRIAAGELLAHQPEAAGQLVDALIIPDRKTQSVIIQVLMRLGEHAVRALVAALRDRALRPSAARVLPQLPGVSDETRAELARLAGSDDPDLRQTALDVIERLGSESWLRLAREADVIPVIPVEGWGERSLAAAELDDAAASKVDTGSFLRALRDGRPAARRNAAFVIARRARADQALAGSLAFGLSALVRDTDAEVRQAAIEALVSIGGDVAVGPLLQAAPSSPTAQAGLAAMGAKAVGWLLDEVRPTQSPAVHAAAVEALRAPGKDAVGPLAAALREHVSPLARALAATALEGLGAAAAAAVPALLLALRDGSDDVRGAAAGALGAIAGQDEVVLAALAEARREGSAAVRRAASGATARLTREPEAPPPSPSPLDRELTPEQAAELVKTLDFAAVVHRDLWSGRVELRRNAALVLRLFGQRQVPSELARLLTVATRDVDAEVRAQSLLALGQLDTPIDLAVPALLRGLADAADTVRAAARDGLDALALRLKAALIPHLVRALFDAQPEVPIAAADLLAREEEAAGPLVEALVYPDRRARSVIVGVLMRLGGQATRALVRALRDPVLRGIAARVLVRLPAVDAESQDELAKLAAGDDADLRAAAAGVLERLGTNSWEAQAREAGVVPTIPVEGWAERALSAAELDAAAASKVDSGSFLRALRDGRTPARQNAAGVVGRRGAADEELAGSLAFGLSALVRDPDADVRQAAVEALARIGGEAAVAPLLTAATVSAPARAALAAMGAKASGWILDEVRGSTPLETRAAAAEALRAPGTDAVAPLAAALREHVSPTARALAATALEGLGAVAAAAVPALLEALRDGSDEVRGAAAGALGAIAGNDDVVLVALAEARREGSAAVRRAASGATARLTRAPEEEAPPPSPLDRDLTPQQAEELVAAKQIDFAAVVHRDLWNGRVEVRRNAALVLRLFGHRQVPSELARLLTVATRDVDAEVRVQSLLALGQLETPMELAVPALLRGLSDPAETVRAAARDGLDALALRVKNAIIPHLLRALLDPQPEVGLAASELLTAQHEAAGPLVEMLVYPDRHVRNLVIQVLIRLREHATRALVKALGEPTLRTIAARLLWQLPWLDGASRDELVRLAGGEDQAVRAAAAEVLEKIGHESAVREAANDATLPDIPVEGWGERLLADAELDAAAGGKIDTGSFLRALRDGRTLVRASAVGVVARRARRDEALAGSLVLALATMVRDHAEEVRGRAVQAVVELGHEAAVPPLLAAVSDIWPAVSDAARGALARLGVKAIGWVLESLSSLQSDATLSAAIDVLAASGKAAVPALTAALEAHASPVAREVAAAALGRLEKDAAAAVPVLVRALRDPSDEVRVEAARALAVVAEPEADVLIALAEARRERVAAVRRAASAAMMRLAPEPPAPEAPPIPIDGFAERPLSVEELAAGKVGVDAFTAALDDGRAAARLNAAVALAARGPDAEEATLALARRLRDTEPAVRAAAAEALGKVAGGHDGVTAVKNLADALLDSDAAVADAAMKALRRLGATAVEGLVGALDRDAALAAVTVVPALAAHNSTAVPPLLKALVHPSVRVRANAAQTLAAMGRGPAEPAREALRAALRDGSTVVRLHARLALDVLDQIVPPPRALPAEPIPFPGFEERLLSEAELGDAAAKLGAVPLMRALGDGRAVVRENAALALGSVTGDGVTIALSITLRDSEPAVRRAAAAALGKAPGAEDARNAVLALCDAMVDSKRAVREEAAQSLATLGPVALPGLLIALDRDPGLAEHTVLPALLAARPAPVEAIGRSLAHSSVRARINAAVALAHLPRGAAEPAREALRVALGDAHELVRHAAQRALDRLDGLDERPSEPPPEPIPVDGFEERFLSADEIGTSVPVERLVRALADGRRVVRRNAAVALGALGAKAAESAPALARSLRDVDAGVRVAGAAAVAALGRPDVAAPALADATVDPDPAVVAAASAALAALGDSALAGLIAALDRDPRRGELTVVPALAALGKAAVPALATALASGPVHVRVNAAAALARLAPTVAEPARAAIQAALADSDDLVKAQARRALDALEGVVPPPRFAPAEPVPIEGFDVAPMPIEALKKQKKKLDVAQLKRFVFDGQKAIRENAARAMQLVGDGVDELLVALKDIDADVRSAAAESLAVLRRDPERVVPALVAVTADASPRPREQALAAVVAYGKDAVEPVLTVLRGRGGVVQAIAEITRRMPDELLAPVTARLAPSESMLVRENVADVLGHLGKDAAASEQVLVAALREIEVPFRAKVIRALGQVATLSPELRETLETLRKKDERPSVQEALKEALRNLASDARLRAS